MKNTISIDFGTSNSTVCWINPRTGMPEVIKDRNGSEKIPSVVYWGAGDEVLVGKAALARLGDAQHDEADSLDAMQRIVNSVKRDLRHNRPRVLPDGRLLKPVDTVAMILGHLKHLAESAAFHETVDSVVLTHPVKMTQREKELLDEAARKAGFQTISFKEEPVAAAHGYLAHGAKVGAGILVFDLGGGTLDLAFLQRDADGSYRMPVECMGDAECGGDDYDQIVYDHWEGQLQAQHGRGFSARSGEINPYVLLECRKAKEKLTDMQTARLSHFLVKDGRHEQALFALTRKEFEVLSAAYAQKAVEQTRKMLKRIGEHGHRVETVLLIGGATRMPLLREGLKAVLPVTPTETMYADVAVALGGTPMAPETTLNPTHSPKPSLEPKPSEPQTVFDVVKPPVPTRNLKALLVEKGKCSRLLRLCIQEEECLLEFRHNYWALDKNVETILVDAVPVFNGVISTNGCGVMTSYNITIRVGNDFYNCGIQYLLNTDFFTKLVYFRLSVSGEVVYDESGN